MESLLKKSLKIPSIFSKSIFKPRGLSFNETMYSVIIAEGRGTFKDKAAAERNLSPSGISRLSLWRASPGSIPSFSSRSRYSSSDSMPTGSGWPKESFGMGWKPWEYLIGTPALLIARITTVISSRWPRNRAEPVLEYLNRNLKEASWRALFISSKTGGISADLGLISFQSHRPHFEHLSTLQSGVWARETARSYSFFKNSLSMPGLKWSQGKTSSKGRLLEV